MSTPQWTESNLMGYLVNAIGAADASIQATFIDKVTQLARIPNAKTKLFVIDKGTANQPNTNYEIILCASHSTALGITTLAGCTRGLAYNGTSLAAGTGKAHVANAEIGCVDVHYLWTILAAQLDGTDPIASNLTLSGNNTHSGNNTFSGDNVFTGINTRTSTTKTADVIQNVTTAQRNALTGVANGAQVYDTDLGQMMWYEGGVWVANAAGGSVPDGTELVAGKWEGATVAEQGTATDTGGTGAHLVPMNKNLVSSSAGAADVGKIGTLDANGKYSNTFLYAPRELQEFGINGTWNKPTSFTPSFVEVVCVGAGGGGGGGYGGPDSADAHHSGSGGGGGALTRKIFKASDLANSVLVGIGAGGAAGVAGAGGNGGNGGVGSATTFGTIFVTYLSAFGGGNGLGGTKLGGAYFPLGGGGGGSAGAGGSGDGGYPGDAATAKQLGGGGAAGTAASPYCGFGEYGGGSGGSSIAGVVVPGGGSLYGGGGGGAGGCEYSSLADNGGAGGGTGIYTYGGGGGGGVGGGNGTNGTGGNSITCGTGGGGGGGKVGTPGGTGGNGGAIGGGGGGGGAGTTNGGAGGAGGAGYCWVYTW